MEYIRVFCENEDVQPMTSLLYFLRSIGMYVEIFTFQDNEDDQTEKSADVQSIADIFIISDAYLDCYGHVIDADDDKSILILKDGWNVGDAPILNVVYTDEENMEDFLNEFMSNLVLILKESYSWDNLRLVDTVMEGEEVLQELIHFYLEYEITPLYLLSSDFPKQYDLYKFAVDRISKMILAIEELKEDYGYFEFLDYCDVYYKAQVDWLCRKNRKICKYDIDEIRDSCDALQERFFGNEQVRLLNAKMQWLFEDKWREAYDELMVSEMSECLEADYYRGKIMSGKYRRLDAAVRIYKYILSKKADFFQAWFECARCYQEMGANHKAIGAYHKVFINLKKKFNKHILSPMEIDYLYKSLIELALIYKNYLHDANTAYAYEELADKLQVEVYGDDYMDLIWDKEFRNEGIWLKIKDIMSDKMDINIEDFF